MRTQQVPFSFFRYLFFLFIVFCFDGCTEVKDIYFSDDVISTDGAAVPHRPLHGKLLVSDVIGVSYMEVVGQSVSLGGHTTIKQLVSYLSYGWLLYCRSRSERQWSQRLYQL